MLFLHKGYCKIYTSKESSVPLCIIDHGSCPDKQRNGRMGSSLLPERSQEERERFEGQIFSGGVFGPIGHILHLQPDCFLQSSGQVRDMKLVTSILNIS